MKYYDKLVFELSQEGRTGFSLPVNKFPSAPEVPAGLRRESALNLPQVSEPDVVRHYTNLSQMNFGVDTGFYPLGSCTMKYNPKINEEMAALPGFNCLHPLMKDELVPGVKKVYEEMNKALAAITGMHTFTFAPCAGAHGELTGLMIMRQYHLNRGDLARTKVIVPDSAHGTNPASAAVAGLEVVEVKSLENGRMTQIEEIASLVHGVGGLLYYDGANMNPLMGVVRPGDMGFDIMHLNLHKTFSTPHGGGGPGSGPVGVAKHLEDCIPAIKVSGFHGNFGVILRAYAYILSLGKDHLQKVGQYAVLGANYIKECLKDKYKLPIEGVCKHEFVFDGLINDGAHDDVPGATTLDVAKRLLDYGFHAPTIYFPLLFHQALMIEPTETESKETLDAFIEVMRKIADEAAQDPNILHEAPHNTPISRPDETTAARNPILKYQEN